MDDRGFIFTTDAILALVVFMVFSASFLTYYALPSYIGLEHSHLETIADDALDTMYRDGTLTAAAVEYAANNTTEGDAILRNSLNMLIPYDTAYKINLGTYPPVIEDRGLVVARDTATRVRVISGPREGWLGRAWFKKETVEFTNQSQNVTTTLWNFHNWLTNFQPWSSYGLPNRPYWGGGSSPQNISLSIPNGATINSAIFLLGSCNKNNNTSYSSNVVINGISHYNITPFTFLNNRPGEYPPQKTYNYQGIINATTLHTGVNNFYVNFLNMTSSQTYDMPWFSILGNYTTTIQVPVGVFFNRTNFMDAAGLAVPNAQELDGNNTTMEYGRIYDLNTGAVSNLYNQRVISWSNLEGQDHGFDDGLPFVITNLPNIQGTRHGSAISIVQNVNVPTDAAVLDAAVYINPYGAGDNAMVEVWNGTEWNTAFRSFGNDESGNSYSANGDGYGNIPGTIAIGGLDPRINFLRPGNNKVRITLWDQVPSSDYDLVGLVDCYSTLTYTYLPIKWDAYAYRSYQSTSNSYTQNRTFVIGPEAKKVYFFVGTGGDSRHIKFEVRNSTMSTWTTLYDSDTIPFMLDIGEIDAASGSHVFTTGPGGNYTIRTGTIRSRITVTSAAKEWESGDAHAELFSGTRIAVLYPQFLENMWATSYSNDPVSAENQARADLIAKLQASGINPDPSLIKTEALYTGDIPNALPVRLDLWKN